MGHPVVFCDTCFFTFLLLTFCALCGREQAEDADAGGGTDVDFALGDHGGDELVADTEIVAAVGGLGGVVDLGEGPGTVGVEDSGISVFGGPDDAILAGVGGDAGGGAGICEGGGGLSGRSGEQFGVSELKLQEGRTDGAVEDVVVQGCGHGPHAAGQSAGEFLVNVVGGGAVLSQVRAIHDVKVGIFASADGEFPGLARLVFLADEEGSAGTEVDVSPIFRGFVVHLEVVGDSESASSGEAEKRIAVVTVRGETGGIQGGVEDSVAIEQVDVAAAVSGHAAAGAPDCAAAAVGSQVDDGGLGQSAGVVAHDPSGVRKVVAVRGPGEINGVIDQQQTGAFFVLRGVESDETVGTVVASAR